MKNSRGWIVQLSTLTGVGIGAWLGGKYSEKRRLSTINNDSHAYIAPDVNIRRFPALPIFGTVSAATPISVPDDPTDMGNKLSAQPRLSQIMKYGFPGLDNIRSYDDYVLSYDKRTRVAHWVFEHLTKENLKCNGNNIDRSKCRFRPDPSIHHYFRSENSDYAGTEYDRGHMAAAGNHKMCQEHVDQTFYLSNIAPQVGNGFNRHSWNRLEKYVRKLTKTYKDVYVCTGPLYLPKVEADGKKYVKYEVIGHNHVAVPTHFYKIVVCETKDSKLEMEAFVMPNKPIDDNTPLNAFQVPPESIERAAGLLFFDKLSKNRLDKINGKKV